MPPTNEHGDRTSVLARVVKTVVGVLLVVAGVVAGAVPVLPGWPLVGLGASLVLAQSAPGRRVMSRLRLRARSRFGSERVREVERRLPNDVLVPHDTTAMRLDLEEHARAKQAARSARRGAR